MTSAPSKRLYRSPPPPKDHHGRRAASAPQLNVVPVNDLSSPLLGFVIVRAFEFDDVADVTLFVENVRPIIQAAVPPEKII
jgi:hypothetical protein